jgi:hypothetical protein
MGWYRAAVENGATLARAHPTPPETGLGLVEAIGQRRRRSIRARIRAAKARAPLAKPPIKHVPECGMR